MSSKLTQEEFIKRSKEIHGKKFNYEFVEFKNVNTKVHLVCNDCGEHIYQTPSNNLFGNGCIVCSGKKPYTTETFIVEAKKIHGDLYDYREVQYTNLNTKVKIWCNKCQKFFFQTPIKHFHGGCITCGGREKLTQEEFIKRSKEIHGENTYDYSNVVYINIKTKVQLTCFRRGHIFNIDPNHHIHRKQGCSICEKELRLERGPNRRSEYIERCLKVHGDKYDYSLIPENVHVTDKVKIYCKKCEKYFIQGLKTHIKSVIGCPKCAGLEKLTKDEFVRRSIEIHGDNYDFSETIIDGVDNKIIVICKKCNKKFITTPYSFMNGVGCVHCNKSTGELRIQRYLDINGINYESEKKFEDCRNIFQLRFDFAILNNDGTVKGLIEFQGKQHYYPVKFNRMSEEKALENFKNVQLRDKIKFDYCFTNQIPLLLIRYSDKKNIEIILSQFIRSLDDLLESL